MDRGRRRGEEGVERERGEEVDGKKEGIGGEKIWRKGRDKATG